MALFLPRACLVLASVLLAACGTPAQAADPVKVGSKRFTESYVLGEIARQALERGGVSAEDLQGLGNTAILEQALSNGQIDVYPEYTGMIASRPGGPCAGPRQPGRRWRAGCDRAWRVGPGNALVKRIAACLPVTLFASGPPAAADRTLGHRQPVARPIGTWSGTSVESFVNTDRRHTQLKRSSR